MTSFVLIGSGCLVCLMPLALYLLYLAYLNQRRRPTLLSGPWDCAALLLGLGGFGVLAGPLALAVLDSRLRGTLFGGNAGRGIRAAWSDHASQWSVQAAAYLAFLALAVAGLLVARRRVTAVYNVPPGWLDARLPEVFRGLGHRTRPVPRGTEFAARKGSAGDDPASPFPAEAGVVELESFAALRHVTLRWRDADRDVRRDAEAALERELEAVASPANPAGGWFMTAALVVFLVMVAWMVFLILSVVPGGK